MELESTQLRRADEAEKVEVRELQELPEEWRRAKLAWLCKELPAHKHTTVVRVLNAQRKWVRQEDATYVAVHCMRIRENETGFRVYKWMMKQHWFRFDFALATKLADFLGKERKYSKCREIFDEILNQGRVPTEFTFHVLVVAYLSSSIEGCLEQACEIYTQMIHLGCYKPRLNLHNSLFKALVGKPGGISKHYLKQAEFVYHNLVTSGLEVHKDIYGGLIWLHSYQDIVDRERIAFLRSEMKVSGIEESKEVLLSIMRACSKVGDLLEAEMTWLKLSDFDCSVPSQAFVYRMETYAKIGQPLKSLKIFREMKDNLGAPSVAAYHKILEVLCRAREMDLAESLMEEFIESGVKPLLPSFIDMIDMYFSLDLHEKLEFAFFKSIEKCRPNRTIYAIYLDSLVKIGNIHKAEEIFKEMLNNEAIGITTRSSNTMLRGYLSNRDYEKAVKMYHLMFHKKYEIEPILMEGVIQVLNSRKKVEKPVSSSLSKEQREILVGLFLGGLHIKADESGKHHIISFEFNEKLQTHNVLKRYIHDQFREWLAPLSEPNYKINDIPSKFSTIPHSYFSFYADQFWKMGQSAVPKLIHRWLSPCTLAYWYSFGGYKTSSGDILLKLRGSEEGIERVARALKTKSLDFRVKKKGGLFWIGFLGRNSGSFWAIVEPYILDDLKDYLDPGKIHADKSTLDLS